MKKILKTLLKLTIPVIYLLVVHRARAEYGAGNISSQLLFCKSKTQNNDQPDSHNCLPGADVAAEAIANDSITWCSGIAGADGETSESKKQLITIK